MSVSVLPPKVQPQKTKLEKPFAELYCEVKRIRRSRFETALLLRSFCPLVRLVVWVSNWVAPSSFRYEKDIMRALRSVTHQARFAALVRDLHDYNRYDLGSWRKMIGLKASPGRLAEQWNQVL